MIISAEHIFKQKKKLDKMRKRVLPKGRTKWEYNDELEIQVQGRVLKAMVEETNGSTRQTSSTPS